MLKRFKPQLHTVQGTVYWSEAVAVIPLANTHWLGSHAAPTPRLALRWLHCRAEDIADQLDTATATPIRAWLQNAQEHEQALRLLADGHPYTFTALDDPTRYILTTRPTLGPAPTTTGRHRAPSRHRTKSTE